MPTNYPALVNDALVVPQSENPNGSTTLNGGGNGVTSSTSSVTVFTVPSEGSVLNSVNNLLAGYKWGLGMGSATNLTTSFLTVGLSSFNYSGIDASSPVTLNANQIDKARLAMSEFAQVANLTFTETTDNFNNAGDIRWGNSSNTNLSTAWASYPSNAARGGDIWFGPNNAAYQAPNVGNYGFYTFIHELGHAMGLRHPHEGLPAANPGEDQAKYSVMSYRGYPEQNADTGIGLEYFQTSLMINDIAALQFLYGANLNYNSGNTTYSWAPDAKVFETIWDGGGTDVIDASNQNLGVKIDLNSGAWSEIGVAFSNGQSTLRNYLTIAYNAVIENATGSAFNDTLVGNGVANALAGGGGNDSLLGGAGFDNLTGGAGNDTLDGGADSDTARYYDAISGVTVNLALGTATGGGGSDTLISIENIDGSQFGDSLTGDANANNLTGQSGNDSLLGGAGFDYLTGGAGNDTLDGGADNDSAQYYDATSAVTVNLALGTATGGSGSDTLISIESIYGSKYGDSLTGDANANTLGGQSGNDTLTGGDGSDQLFGDDGNDSLLGGAGDDYLTGGAGNDTLDGGAGNDTYIVDTLTDVVTELANEGTDTIQTALGSYSLAALANVENLAYTGAATFIGTGNALANTITGNNGNDTIFGGLGNDTIFAGFGFDSIDGGDGDDFINGGFNGDTIFGGAGNDFIGSGNGKDVIDGGDGNDTLRGGFGADTITGGTGNDHFQFLHAVDGIINVDTLLDLQTGQDVMELSAAIFTVYAGQVGNFVSTSANMSYNSLTGVLAYDADGAGAGAPLTIAILGTSSHPASLGADFLIVA